MPDIHAVITFGQKLTAGAVVLGFDLLLLSLSVAYASFFLLLVALGWVLLSGIFLLRVLRL